MAVLAVIVFHAFPALAPGGLVGVDIFFVISGYLITGIVAADLDREQFTLRRFYLRRIRRIFPALAAVLTAVTIAAWFWLLPDEWRNYGKHLFAGTAFVSNLALAQEVGYFDWGARFKPLLHLWSLGIEEQYYLVWPLFLAVLWKASQRVRFAAVATVVAGSFALNLLAIGRYPSLTFYLPFTRVWELGIGSLLALTAANRPASRLRTELASWSGVALVLASLVVIRENEGFPGAWALLPTVGTALLIVAGEKASFNRLVLARRGAVAVGLISYPLYLWHWPLLTLAFIAGNGERSVAMTLGCVAASFILSMLTYRFVEQPIRGVPRFGRRLAFVCAVLVVLLALGIAIQNGRIRARLSSDAVEEVLAGTKEWEYPFGQNYRRRDGFVRSTVAGTAPGVVLFIGDSHMEQHWPRLAWLRGHHALPELRFATNGGCPPLPELAAREEECRAFHAFALDEARDPAVTTVVFAAAWPHYLNRHVEDRVARKSVARLRDEIGALVRAGKRVFVILATPASPRLDPRRMIDRKRGTIAAPALPVGDLLAENGAATAMVRSAALAAGAEVIDPIPALCPDGVCPSKSADGRVIYRDSSHFRPFYVRERATYVDRVVASEARP